MSTTKCARTISRLTRCASSARRDSSIHYDYRFELREPDRWLQRQPSIRFSFVVDVAQAVSLRVDSRISDDSRKLTACATSVGVYENRSVKSPMFSKSA